MYDNFKSIVKMLIGAKNIERLLYKKKHLSIIFNRLYKVYSSSKTRNIQEEEYFVRGHHTFFGYYDKTPFSFDNSKMLATLTSCNTRTPKPSDVLSVGYFDLSNKTFNKIGQTTTWCWQQGCRLQWFPKNENDLVIYNKIINNKYGSVIYDIKSNTILQECNNAIYDVSSNCTNALTLNFSRLQRLRPGYGYVNLEDISNNDPCPSYDGVWLYNFINNKTKLLYSLDFLTRLEPLETMENAEHYINHLSFNPSGNRFLFIHLWVKNGKRYNRMLTSDIDGENIFVLVNEGHVSHYTWKSDTEILAFASHKETGTNYYLYIDQSRNREVVGGKVLIEDGHPTYSNDKKIILTDTYPDKFGEQHLLAYKNSKIYRINSYYNDPMKFYGENRCDLHPRWDRSCTKVSIDKISSRKRIMSIVSIDFE